MYHGAIGFKLRIKEQLDLNCDLSYNEPMDIPGCDLNNRVSIILYLDHIVLQWRSIRITISELQYDQSPMQLSSAIELRKTIAC